MLKLDKTSTQQIIGEKPAEHIVSNISFYTSPHGIVMKNQFDEYFLVTPEEKIAFLANLSNPCRKQRILG